MSSGRGFVAPAERAAVEPHAAQDRSRLEIFTDYRIRVMSLVRDYGMSDRDQAPQKRTDV